MGGDGPCGVELLKQTQTKKRWIHRHLSVITEGTNGPMRAKDKVSVPFSFVGAAGLCWWVRNYLGG